MIFCQKLFIVLLLLYRRIKPRRKTEFSHTTLKNKTEQEAEGKLIWQPIFIRCTGPREKETLLRIYKEKEPEVSQCVFKRHSLVFHTSGPDYQLLASLTELSWPTE